MLPGLPCWVDSVSVSVYLCGVQPHAYTSSVQHHLCPVTQQNTCVFITSSVTTSDLFFLVLPVVLLDVGCSVASGTEGTHQSPDLRT